MGGTYTVATSAGLARISSSDADALGVDPDEKQEKQAEADRLADATLEEQVWHQMKQVFDPEIPVDIVNLGLVYDCTLSEVDSGTDVDVKMTLTAPGCGMGPSHRCRCPSADHVAQRDKRRTRRARLGPPLESGHDFGGR